MEQRTPEWFAARRGKITASRFGDVMAGKGTKRRKAYLDDVVDGLMGVPEFPDDPPWFAHGIRNEKKACGSYEWEKEMAGEPVDVGHIGMFVHPEYPFITYSPDGVMVGDGRLEIKCRKSLRSHLESVRTGIDSCYKPQCQGGLWVSGGEWLDFVSYYESENLGMTLTHIYRIKPDEKYIQKIETACLEFWREVQEAIR